MFTQENVDNLLSRDGHVVGSDNEKIGSVGQFYLDDQTNEPSWVTVRTGLFGTSESFVPLEGANMAGDDLRVAYTKEQVKDAPRVAADGQLSPEEEEVLYRHYGINGYNAAAAGDLDRDRTAFDSDSDRDFDSDRTQVGHDTSGPTTDDAMTRSEERLHVGTEQQETGRARLRKYVVTENVTTTVPVSREEVRVEREPITDGNVGSAMSGPEISEEEHEVVLHEERPVVEKETVPVERVRMDTETVTDQETVSGEVRKEQIDVDGVEDVNRRDDR